MSSKMCLFLCKYSCVLLKKLTLKVHVNLCLLILFYFILFFTFSAIERNCSTFWEIDKKTDTSLICGIDYPCVSEKWKKKKKTL